MKKERFRIMIKVISYHGLEKWYEYKPDDRRVYKPLTQEEVDFFIRCNAHRYGEYKIEEL